MNYAMYDKEDKLIAVNSAKNKEELRIKVMSSKHWQNIAKVIYGRKTYTAAQIYSELPIK